jgi:hypothetical protein
VCAHNRRMNVTCVCACCGTLGRGGRAGGGARRARRRVRGAGRGRAVPRGGRRQGACGSSAQPHIGFVTTPPDACVLACILASRPCLRRRPRTHRAWCSSTCPARWAACLRLAATAATACLPAAVRTGSRRWWPAGTARRTWCAARPCPRATSCARWRQRRKPTRTAACTTRAATTRARRWTRRSRAGARAARHPLLHRRSRSRTRNKTRKRAKKRVRRAALSARALRWRAACRTGRTSARCCCTRAPRSCFPACGTAWPHSKASAKAATSRAAKPRRRRTTAFGTYAQHNRL